MARVEKKRGVVGAVPDVRGMFAGRFWLTVSLLVAFGWGFVSAASAEEIRSRAAVVMDATTGRVLYAKNPELRLKPASTTKLMTALVVVERSNLQDVVTISSRAANTAPTRSGLKAGDKVTIETLLYAALMRSANDAAVALAEAVAGSEEKFVELMNRKALVLGANDTRFINANGLPGGGQFTTAYDLAKIMRQAIKHPVLKEILGTRITEVSTEGGKTVFLKNTNKLLWADDEVLGGKTGFTYQARHCFVCAGERNDNTMVVSLLGAPSRDLLWKETESLLTFGNRVLVNQEEPVVYLTKDDYDEARVATVSYGKKAGKKAATVKSKKRAVGAKKAIKVKHAVKKKKPEASAARKAEAKKAVGTKKTNMVKQGSGGAEG